MRGEEARKTHSLPLRRPQVAASKPPATAVETADTDRRGSVLTFRWVSLVHATRVLAMQPLHLQGKVQRQAILVPTGVHGTSRARYSPALSTRRIEKKVCTMQNTHLWQLDTTSIANCLLITSAFFEGSSAFSNASLCQSRSWLSSDHTESSILCFPATTHETQLPPGATQFRRKPLK